MYALLYIYPHLMVTFTNTCHILSNIYTPFPTFSYFWPKKNSCHDLWSDPHNIGVTKIKFHIFWDSAKRLKKMVSFTLWSSLSLGKEVSINPLGMKLGRSRAIMWSLKEISRFQLVFPKILSVMSISQTSTFCNQFRMLGKQNPHTNLPTICSWKHISHFHTLL
jgi:hypothetical protein